MNIVLKGEDKLSSDYYYGIAIVDPANKDSVTVTISGDVTSGNAYEIRVN